MIRGFINVNCKARSTTRLKSQKTTKARQFANLFCESLNDTRPVIFPLSLNSAVRDKAVDFGQELPRHLETLCHAANASQFYEAMIPLSRILEKEGVLLRAIHFPGSFILLTGEISVIHKTNGIRVLSSHDFSKNFPPEAFTLFASDPSVVPELIILREGFPQQYYDFLFGKQNDGALGVFFSDLEPIRRLRIRDEILGAPSDSRAMEFIFGFSGREQQFAIQLFFLRRAIESYRKLNRQKFVRAVDKVYLHALILHEFHHLLEKIMFNGNRNMYSLLFSEEERATREFTAELASLAYQPQVMFQMFEFSGLAINNITSASCTSPHQLHAVRQIFSMLLDSFGNISNLMWAEPQLIREKALDFLDRFYHNRVPSFQGYEPMFETGRIAEGTTRVLTRL